MITLDDVTRVTYTIGDLAPGAPALGFFSFDDSLVNGMGFHVTNT